LETDGGEFMAIKNEGPIDPVSKTVIKTKSIFSANGIGKYRDLNHGAYVGEPFGTLNAKALIFSFTNYGAHFQFFIRSR
jgi:hypothetical protein